MAKRYIGDAVITIEYVGETPDGLGRLQRHRPRRQAHLALRRAP